MRNQSMQFQPDFAFKNRPNRRLQLRDPHLSCSPLPLVLGPPSFSFPSCPWRCFFSDPFVVPSSPAYLEELDLPLLLVSSLG